MKCKHCGEEIRQDADGTWSHFLSVYCNRVKAEPADREITEYMVGEENNRLKAEVKQLKAKLAERNALCREEARQLRDIVRYTHPEIQPEKIMLAADRLKAAGEGE